MKKNDRVKFKHNNVEMIGTVISNPYRFIVEKEDYIEVQFDELNDILPVPINMLEVI